MKKFIITLLAFSMIVVLGACSKVEPSNKDKETAETKETADTGEDESETEETTSTEDETQEEIEQVRGEIPDFGTLSDDIYSFQVEINGDLYQFPMKYTDFVSYGWNFNEDDTENLDSYFKLLGSFDNNGLSCRADVVNFDISAKPASECYVTSISIDSFRADQVDNFSLRLPKGLEFGKATVEEIEEAYGIPTDKSEGDYSTRLTYRKDTYQVVNIRVSNETGFIEEVDIENVSMPEDFTESEVSTEVPDIVSKYKAPDKLEENFDSYTVEFGGDLYQLPAPVSSFVKNGWVVVEDETDMTISGRGFGYVTFEKDNQKLRVGCNNYSEGATSIENCFVTTIKSGDSDNNTKIVIPQKLTIGSSEADLEKAITGVEHEKDDSSDSYTFYRIIPGESSLENYEIIVRDGAISKIEVNNAPKYSEFTK